MFWTNSRPENPLLCYLNHISLTMMISISIFRMDSSFSHASCNSSNASVHSLSYTQLNFSQSLVGLLGSLKSAMFGFPSSSCLLAKLLSLKMIKAA